MKRIHLITGIKPLALTVLVILIAGCTSKPKAPEATVDMDQKRDKYVEVTLRSDLINDLSRNQREMVSILFDVAEIMNEIFWQQAYGDKSELLTGETDPKLAEFLRINYGPWDRLEGNEPFVKGYGQKPAGANFYPEDMTKEEYNNFDNPTKNCLYTLIRRDKSGDLKSISYHKAFEEKTKEAAVMLKKASELAENQALKRYLELRSEALLSDDYFKSDMAWMEMRNNKIDMVVGPIENYEDGLFGYKAAHEAFVLLKDLEWSQRLERFNPLLPELQKTLPVPEEYKQEEPGSDSDLGAYDAIYYAGDCNAGSKTIAINLPNDEKVQLEKGTRKLQLKNAMQAKFDKILIPISNVLIDEEQRAFLNFRSFFENTMFHEVAHGLGIKNTINGNGTVREALKEQYSPIEEGKADILGLFLVTRLAEMEKLDDNEIMDNYVTFMASIFRSIRFGASSAHGKANMIRFNYFQEKGAFTRDEATGTYRVNFEEMQQAMNELGEEILVIQGDGNYEAAKKLVKEQGIIKSQLQEDLDRVSEAGIPVDIVFNQGKSVAGLE